MWRSRWCSYSSCIIRDIHWLVLFDYDNRWFGEHRASLIKYLHRLLISKYSLLLVLSSSSVDYHQLIELYSFHWDDDRCVIRWRFFIITSWFTDLIDCRCWALDSRVEMELSHYGLRMSSSPLHDIDPRLWVDVLSIHDVIVHKMSGWSVDMDYLTISIISCRLFCSLCM